MNKNLTFIDLFAGIGGLGIPFRELGWKCVFSSEIDKYACQTYQANFNETPFGDINEISPENIPDHDLLLAGFPCQPFSSIGKRGGFNDKKNGILFFCILKILKAKLPTVFLLENVPGIKTINKGETFNLIQESLKKLNYNLAILEENAKDYGLPQKRKRIYFIGVLKSSLKNKFNFKKRTFKEEYIGKYLEKLKEGYEISDKVINNYLFKKKDGKPEIVHSLSKIQVKTLVASYHKIQRLTGTFVEDEHRIRLLSEKECKIIMGFPQDFIFPVSRTQMYRQLGNSVAIPVIREIANQLKNYL